jgi:hypothetical protein
MSQSDAGDSLIAEALQYHENGLTFRNTLKSLAMRPRGFFRFRMRLFDKSAVRRPGYRCDRGKAKLPLLLRNLITHILEFPIAHESFA